MSIVCFSDCSKVIIIGIISAYTSPIMALIIVTVKQRSWGSIYIPLKYWIRVIICWGSPITSMPIPISTYTMWCIRKYIFFSTNTFTTSIIIPYFIINHISSRHIIFYITTHTRITLIYCFAMRRFFFF